MLTRFRQLIRQFFSKTRTIDNQPLNVVSLIVIILIDIFILANVFFGLQGISDWHLRPNEAYPCYTNWEQYRQQTTPEKDYLAVKPPLPYMARYKPPALQQTYQDTAIDRLGQVSPQCLEYAAAKDQITTDANQQLVKKITDTQIQVDSLEQKNRTIREQYDSTLLEKLAGQSPDKSINQTSADKAKQSLDQNTRRIAELKQEITTLKQQLVAKPESVAFLNLLRNDGQFQQVEKGFQSASFWYPSIQLIFQAVFLLPLILIAYAVHRLAQRRGYGLVALISWHLLIIFFIPLILKVFQFLQVGVLFEFILRVIQALFGGLLFLVSYAYILLIPVIGFGIIKFFQRFVFNPKLQAANRIQKTSCIQCARKLRPQDSYCPHCGYYQYQECPHCHNFTYKYLPYCKQCGTAIEEHTHS